VPTKEVESGFDDPHYLIEFRGIRGGEMGGSAPIKTPPRVRLPTRNPATKKFDVDEAVMKAAARHQGLSEANWTSEVKAIPVFVTTDKIQGDDGVIYLERAFYTGRGRMCSSAYGSQKANQVADVRAYAKNKSLKMHPQPQDVDCNRECPMWAKNGEKSDCGWRAIVNMQLIHRPVFPSRSVHRTRSFYSIMSMISSLTAISRVTGGVLSGIPLMFRQHLIDIRQADGQNRRIPVMTFDFDGPLIELRRLAIEEMTMRRTLSEALAGNDVKAPAGRTVFTPMAMGDDLAVDGDDDASDDTAAAAAEESVEVDATAVQSEVAALASKLGYTAARMRLLEQKHEGDLGAMLTELRTEAGGTAPATTGKNWGPGDAGDDLIDADDLDF
jgi:hypothetical protein